MLVLSHSHLIEAVVMVKRGLEACISIPSGKSCSFEWISIRLKIYKNKVYSPSVVNLDYIVSSYLGVERDFAGRFRFVLEREVDADIKSWCVLFHFCFQKYHDLCSACKGAMRPPLLSFSKRVSSSTTASIAFPN